MVGRHEGVGCLLGPLRRQPAATDACQDPGDVGVDDRHVALEGECEHGSGGVRADAGKREQRVEIVGQATVVLLDDDAGGSVQVPRPPRVTEALPSSEHLAERHRCARRRSRERFQERLPLRHDPVGPGLLEHHLGDENSPGVAIASPGEVAEIVGAPGEDGPRIDHGARTAQAQSAQTSVPSYGRLRSGANSRFQISTLRTK